MLLVMVYAKNTWSKRNGRGYIKSGGGDGYYVGRPAWFHDAVARHLSTELCAAVRDRWNGGEGHSGISMIFDRPCPQSLLVAMTNYRELVNVFRISAAETERFRSFDRWVASANPVYGADNG